MANRGIPSIARARNALNRPRSACISRIGVGAIQNRLVHSISDMTDAISELVGRGMAAQGAADRSAGRMTAANLDHEAIIDELRSRLDDALVNEFRARLDRSY